MTLTFKVYADFIQYNYQEEDATNDNAVPIDFPKDFHYVLLDFYGQ